MTIKWHNLLLDEMELFLKMARSNHNKAQFEELASRNKEKIIEIFEEQQRETERLRKALEEINNEGLLHDGSREYSGKSHGNCVRIARQALNE